MCVGVGLGGGYRCTCWVDVGEGVCRCRWGCGFCGCAFMWVLVSMDMLVGTCRY